MRPFPYPSTQSILLLGNLRVPPLRYAQLLLCNGSGGRVLLPASTQSSLNLSGCCRRSVMVSHTVDPSQSALTSGPVQDSRYIFFFPWNVLPDMCLLHCRQITRPRSRYSLRVFRLARALLRCSRLWAPSHSSSLTSGGTLSTKCSSGGRSRRPLPPLFLRCSRSAAGGIRPSPRDSIASCASSSPATPNLHSATEYRGSGSAGSLLLARIHRGTALGTALEEARGCSCESGIMVLEQKTGPRKGAPNRCCHRTNPTVSASSLTTTAWWPMPG